MYRFTGRFFLVFCHFLSTHSTQFQTYKSFCAIYRALNIWTQPELLALQAISLLRLMTSADLQFDPLLRDGVRLSGTAGQRAITFTWCYHWVKDAMHFQTSITIRTTGESLENDIILYPLQTKALETLLHAASFREINWYSSFSGDSIDVDSFVSIAHSLA